MFGDLAHVCMQAVACPDRTWPSFRVPGATVPARYKMCVLTPGFETCCSFPTVLSHATRQAILATESAPKFGKRGEEAGGHSCSEFFFDKLSAPSSFAVTLCDRIATHTNSQPTRKEAASVGETMGLWNRQDHHRGLSL